MTEVSKSFGPEPQINHGLSVSFQSLEAASTTNTAPSHAAQLRDTFISDPSTCPGCVDQMENIGFHHLFCGINNFTLNRIQFNGAFPVPVLREGGGGVSPMESNN